MGWRGPLTGTTSDWQNDQVVGGEGDLSSTCLTTCYSCRQHTGGKNLAACLHLIPPCAATWTHNTTRRHSRHTPHLDTASPFIIHNRPVRRCWPHRAHLSPVSYIRARFGHGQMEAICNTAQRWSALTHLLRSRPRCPSLRDLRCCRGRHVPRYCGFPATPRHS